jgi:hypothetical protein
MVSGLRRARYILRRYGRHSGIGIEGELPKDDLGRLTVDAAKAIDLASSAKCIDSQPAKYLATERLDRR